jgi:hypothetical protein
MNNAEYHAADGISSSNLKLLAESPVHLKNKHLFKFSSTACDFGSLVHALILEPETVDDEFVVMPQFDARTKDGKAAKAEFEARSGSKIIVSADDMDKAETMAQNAVIIAGGLLMNGVAESSHFVDDDGLILKCRPDYYIESAGVVVDIKTIADCSEFNIRKAITNYKYHWSAAWYLRVLSLLGKPAKKFVFVFIDKQAPHMVRIRELTPESLELAYLEIDQMLASYRHYLATGQANVVKPAAIFGE